MQVAGVEAAFQFSPKGEIIEYDMRSESELTESVLDLLSHVCVANLSIATMQARGWETMTGMQGFYPVKGFTLVGFTWTAITNEDFGMVIPNEQVDYEAAYAALAG
ncbi:DUF2173 family protein [Beggiatoa alba]|nr:DUF2173 family protein [Beggiatoa alba]